MIPRGVGPQFVSHLTKGISQPMKTLTRISASLLSIPIVFALLVSQSLAQDWRDIAFPVKEHDFGTVAVAAKTECYFQVFNNFSTPMKLESVRASCGCTLPTILDPYIAPGETGSIHARFKTESFRGKKGATLTVVMTQPFYSEIQLKVKGYIRSDMVFHPGELNVGRIAQGETATKSAKVMYAGRPDWKIVDVRSNKPWILPRFHETNRDNGTVVYEIVVDIREDASSGSFMDELVITTNDRSKPNVPFRVSGVIESQLTVSPLSLPMGSIKPGEPVSKKIVLIGKSPFVIGSISADGWDVNNVKIDGAEKKMHILHPELTYVGDQVGPQKVSLVIQTAGEGSVIAKTLITADIRGE